MQQIYSKKLSALKRKNTQSYKHDVIARRWLVNNRESIEQTTTRNMKHFLMRQHISTYLSVQNQ